MFLDNEVQVTTKYIKTKYKNALKWNKGPLNKNCKKCSFWCKKKKKIFLINIFILFRFVMTREDAMKVVIDNLSQKDVVVSATGMLSRELFEYR